MKDPIRFARQLCYFAGWYGILTLLPLLFMEAKFGSDLPPAVNHPEFYYGFIAVALSWQIALLLLGRDPLAHRLFLFPATLEKLSFATSCLTLFAMGKVPSIVALLGVFDLILAGCFFFAYRRLSSLTM